MDRSLGENGYIYMYDWVPLLSTWNYNNTANWLCCCCSVAQSCSTLCNANLPKFMFIASVMLSSYLILWCPLLLLPSIYPSTRDFPNESSDQNTGVSASVLPVNIQGWPPLRLADLITLLSEGLSGVFSSTVIQRHQFFGILPSLRYSCHNHMWLLGRP